MKNKYLWIGAVLALKLPYLFGGSFVAVQAYNSPPTHVGKDLYAIDFSQLGCDAYAKFAIAASSGKIFLIQQEGYNGGYGTQVLVEDDSGTVLSRYAHLIPGSIPYVDGETVFRGEPMGAIGNTGLVAGAACPAHPGTHLHFAMYDKHSDGSYTARLPEPISGYTKITAGKWYLSDNDITTDVSLTPVLGAPIATSSSQGDAGLVAIERDNVAALSGIGAVASTPSTPIPNGGVSVAAVAQPVSPAPQAPVLVPEQSTGTLAVASSTPPSPDVSASFNSSTLTIDLAWAAASTTQNFTIFRVDPANTSSAVQIGVTTSTTFSYSLTNSDFAADDYLAVQADDGTGNLSSLAFASTTIPNWFTAIQLADDTNSNGSGYSDNWYDLGTGFYATIRALTLEGFIDNSLFGASQLWLDEYLDADYTELNQTFTISADAPFKAGLQKITIADLNIPLQPNKYYRLRTFQGYQNRSIILAGTPATGTAMWNEFITGTGRVEHQYAFYPYLSAVMIPNYPPLAPPNQVTSVADAFDAQNMQVTISWPPATDPDTTSSLLTYQVNISTSTELDPTTWQPVGKNLSASLPVMFGNSYTIGIRTVDDMLNISEPFIEQWHFPPDFVPAPEQLDHSGQLPAGAQKIVLSAPMKISGIALWTVSDINGPWCCGESFVSVHSGIGDAIGPVIAASDPVSIGQRLGPREEVYSFDAPFLLGAGEYWIELDKGPTQNTDPTYVFGSDADLYPDGDWSTAPGHDAYFRIIEE